MRNNVRLHLTADIRSATLRDTPHFHLRYRYGENVVYTRKVRRNAQARFQEGRFI